MEGEEVEVMVDANPSYGEYVTYEKGKKVLYLRLRTALYGIMQAALLWYETYSVCLKKNGFKLNPYDPCIANKIINGKQCTICWHVDDNKISHEDPKVVDEVINMIKNEFHDVTVKRGNKHAFIGMDVKMNEDGTVTLSMKDYIEESIKAMWYRTKGSCTRVLAPFFGQTASPMYKWLKFGRIILLHVLSNHEAAKVRLPTSEELESFKVAVSAKYPHCPNVWEAADGLKIMIMLPKGFERQLRFYNSWQTLHFVNYSFTFSVHGEIRIVILNAPGNFHDSTIADYGDMRSANSYLTVMGGK